MAILIDLNRPTSTSDLGTFEDVRGTHRRRRTWKKVVPYVEMKTMVLEVSVRADDPRAPADGLLGLAFAAGSASTLALLKLVEQTSRE